MESEIVIGTLLSLKKKKELITYNLKHISSDTSQSVSVSRSLRAAGKSLTVVGGERAVRRKILGCFILAALFFFFNWVCLLI